MRHTPHGGVEMPNLDRNVWPCPYLRLIVEAEKHVLGEGDIHYASDGYGAISILLREELRQLLNVRAAPFPHCIGDPTGKCFDPVVIRLRAVDGPASREPNIRPRCIFRKPIAKLARQFPYCLFVIHVNSSEAMSALGRKRTLAALPPAVPSECPLSARSGHSARPSSGDAAPLCRPIPSPGGRARHGWAVGS